MTSVAVTRGCRHVDSPPATIDSLRLDGPSLAHEMKRPLEVPVKGLFPSRQKWGRPATEHGPRFGRTAVVTTARK